MTFNFFFAILWIGLSLCQDSYTDRLICFAISVIYSIGDQVLDKLNKK